MGRKRPFFLLEIVIAITLVGLFSSYFLRSSIHSIYRERTALLDLEFERHYDLKRVELLAQAWKEIDNLPEFNNAEEKAYPFPIDFGGKSYSRSRQFKIGYAKKHDNIYDVVIQEDRKEKFHFLIRASEAINPTPK